MNQAVEAIRQYLTGNPALFAYFVTICLSPLVWGNRQSPKGIAHKVRLLDELWRGMGYDFRYLLVPEIHPKSGAYHIHGAIAGLPDYELCRFDSKEKLPQYIYQRVKSGVDIYHSPTIEKLFGYNVITPITDMGKISNYLTKHMTLCEDPPFVYCYLFSGGDEAWKQV